MSNGKSSTLVFYVNGKRVVENHAEPETTLLQYLRNNLRLTGTKLGCGEGGCGACTVMVSKFDRKQHKIVNYSVNACLAPICSLHGQAVTTVEGIGSVKHGLHPVQERLAKSHGSQCGFCTPGIIMSMYTLLRNNPTPGVNDMEKAFEGNLCRCTGYRPILDGFRPFTKEYCQMGENCCRNKKNSSQPQQQLTNGDIGETEYLPLDPSQDPIFPPELQKSVKFDSESLIYKGERVTWYRPTSLDELLLLKSEYPDAKVVVGNTEVGVEVKFKDLMYPVIICPSHVPEMNSITHTEKGIQFGASVTLTNIDHELKDALQKYPEHETRVFTAVVEMLRWFAGYQIRNVAAVGGNIVTASPISDLNPLFLACGAVLEVESKDEGRRQIVMDSTFFKGYRKTAIKQGEVLLNITIPFSSKNEYFYGYKQAYRREDDIATVNAGIRVLFEGQSNIIKNMSFAYGGMAPITVMATNTMNMVVGRKWDDDLVRDVCQCLSEDLPLPAGSPGGMIEYRRTLTTSFFFKFYLTVQLQLQSKHLSTKNKVPSYYRSATPTFHRDSCKSTQVYNEKVRAEGDALGKPMCHVSAEKQATGEAIYVDDIPKHADELYMAPVFSTVAHASIKHVDPSVALSMPGVKDYVSHMDVPGSNRWGAINIDEEVFASTEVSCQGQMIGAVLADTQVHAQRAAKSVMVKYDELTPIVTIKDAISKGSFYTQYSNAISCGDVEKAFKQTDHVIEGEFHMGGQEHFYLETHACLAVPKGEDGEMEMFVSTQNPTETQTVAAEALGVSANRIVVRTKRLGGGFGGKETRSIPLSTAAAVAAAKVGVPVRCMLDRNEDMISSGTRHPFYAKYKAGFTDNGKIVALDIDIYNNAGCSLDLSPGVMDRALFHVDNAYKIPNLSCRGHLCKTNIPSNTAFRGFGGPQGMVMIEEVISQIAMNLGISQTEIPNLSRRSYLCKTNIPSNTAFRGFGGPQGMVMIEEVISQIAMNLRISQTEIRRINLYQEGDRTHFNQELIPCQLPKCWDECMKQSDFTRRKREVDIFNSENRWKKRGIAMMPTKFGIAFTAIHLNQSGALIHIYQDGSVLLTHGGVEMGQGLHTKMIQVASKALNIPPTKIHISETCTNTVPNTSPTAASSSSDLNGMAILNACKTLLERLDPIKKGNPKGTWEEWVKTAYLQRIGLSAAGFYRTPGIGYNFKTGQGKPFSYFTNGVACSEVEIDCLTGDHQVLRTDIVMDVGTSINPAIDVGQIEGAFMQGYGLMMMEQQKVSPSGYMITRGPGNYKIPGFGDIPVEFNVSLLKDSRNEKAVYSSKAIGEPPLFLASSVFFAVKEAILSARSDAGHEGSFVLLSPATPERIRMACEDQFTELFPKAEEGTYKPWFVEL